MYSIYSIYSIYGMYSTVYWCWEICFETDTVQYCTYSITCTVNGGCSGQSSSDFFKALYLSRISSPSSCSFASAALLAFSLISSCTAIFFNPWQTVENCAVNVGNHGAIQKWLFFVSWMQPLQYCNSSSNFGIWCCTVLGTQKSRSHPTLQYGTTNAKDTQQYINMEQPWR